MAESETNRLVEQSVEVLVSDPWDFMTELGTMPIQGRVASFEAAGGRLMRLVIDLVSPVAYKGSMIGRFDAIPRHKDSPTVERFAQGVALQANIQGIVLDPARRARPIALLGEVRLA